MTFFSRSGVPQSTANAGAERVAEEYGSARVLSVEDEKQLPRIVREELPEEGYETITLTHVPDMP